MVDHLKIIFAANQFTLQKGGGLSGQSRNNLLKGIVIHAHAGDFHAGLVQFGTQQQSGSGSAGTGGGHDVTDFDAGSLGLLREFPDAVHIAQRAQCVGAAAGNEVGLVSLFGQLVCNYLHFSVNIVIAVSVHEADIGTVDLVQNQVALAVRDAPLFEDEDALHAQPCGAGSGQHGMIGLGAAGGEHGVAALSLSLCQQILQLADLIAAKGHTAQVIPLDPDVLSVFGADLFQLIKRRGIDSQRKSGQRQNVLHGLASQFGNASGDVSSLVNSAAGHQHIGACLNAGSAGVGSHAAVHFQLAGRILFVD